MADIHHDFYITAPGDAVFDAVGTPIGLDAWWTNRCSGTPDVGSVYELDFGPECRWSVVVIRCEPAREFEMEFTRADDDWLNSRVRFSLDDRGGRTHVRFSHTGWPEINDHFRTSSFCWAMYLRLLKRYVEFGEVVPYERRLEV